MKGSGHSPDGRGYDGDASVCVKKSPSLASEDCIGVVRWNRSGAFCWKVQCRVRRCMYGSANLNCACRRRMNGRSQDIDIEMGASLSIQGVCEELAKERRRRRREEATLFRLQLKDARAYVGRRRDSQQSRWVSEGVSSGFPNFDHACARPPAVCCT